MREIERKRAKQSETLLRSSSIDDLMTPSAKGAARQNSQSLDSEDQYFEGSPNIEDGEGINSNTEAIIPQAEEDGDGAQDGGHLILPNDEKIRNQVL